MLFLKRCRPTGDLIEWTLSHQSIHTIFMYISGAWSIIRIGCPRQDRIENRRLFSTGFKTESRLKNAYYRLYSQLYRISCERQHTIMHLIFLYLRLCGYTTMSSRLPIHI